LIWCGWGLIWRGRRREEDRPKFLLGVHAPTPLGASSEQKNRGERRIDVAAMERSAPAGCGRQRVVVEAGRAYGFRVGVRVRNLGLLGEGYMTDDLRGDARGGGRPDGGCGLRGGEAGRRWRRRPGGGGPPVGGASGGGKRRQRLRRAGLCSGGGRRAERHVGEDAGGRG
jgi:hypothetical protein